jgi:hypothetical protein
VRDEGRRGGEGRGGGNLAELLFVVFLVLELRDG